MILLTISSFTIPAPISPSLIVLQYTDKGNDNKNGRVEFWLVGLYSFSYVLYFIILIQPPLKKYKLFNDEMKTKLVWKYYYLIQNY